MRLNLLATLNQANTKKVMACQSQQYFVSTMMTLTNLSERERQNIQGHSPQNDIFICNHDYRPWQCPKKAKILAITNLPRH